MGKETFGVCSMGDCHEIWGDAMWRVGSNKSYSAKQKIIKTFRKFLEKATKEHSNVILSVVI